MKNTTKEKVRKKSKEVDMIYVNQNAYSKVFRLWKTAVEKSVENVEKYRFSTGISHVWPFPQVCITGRIMGARRRLRRHYVIAERKGIPEELWRKSW